MAVICPDVLQLLHKRPPGPPWLQQPQQLLPQAAVFAGAVPWLPPRLPHLLLSAAATTLTTRAMGDSVGATCL